MLRHVFSRFAVALIVCIGLAAPGSAALFIVDCDMDAPFDFTMIQPAVTAAAAAPEGIVVIRPCLYVENVSMTGAHNVHLVAAEEPNLVGADGAGVATSPFTSGVIIDGGGAGPCLTINNSSRVSVTGIVMTNCLGEGISLGVGADFVKLHNNSLYGFPGMGIRANGAQGIVITSNWITQTEHHGMRLDNVQTGLIADNVLAGSSVPNSAGIFVGSGSQFVEVLNNEITAYMGPGVRDQGTATRIERNTAAWNCISGVFPCFCDQIIARPGSIDADIVGNETTPAGGWSLCGSGGEDAENI